jgi:replicative DNA helicase
MSEHDMTLTRERLCIAMLFCSSMGTKFAMELLPEYFLVNEHKRIIGELRRRIEAGEEVTPHDVAYRARIPLADMLALIEDHLNYDVTTMFAVKSAWIVREVRRISSEALDEIADGAQILNHVREQYDVLEAKIRSGLPADKSGERFAAELTNPAETFPFGVPILDKWLGGLERGEVIDVAARPGTGKTAFCVQLALNLARLGIRVDFHSFEMTDAKIRRRFVANVGSIPMHAMKNRTLTPVQVETALAANNWISTTPLRIYASADLNIDGVAGAIRETDAPVIILDHLSCIISTVKGNKNETVGEVSNKLRRAAKSSNKTVILAVQMNRASEREKRVPVLADLRDSGEIEQDADMVMFLHQPEKDSDDKARRDLVDIDIVVAKARDGQLGYERVIFHKPYMRFFDEEQQRLANMDRQQEANF